MQRLETVAGRRGHVASGNGPRSFEMKDHDHDLRDNFIECDRFGCVRRKCNAGDDRRQPARRAYAEVRSYLLSVCCGLRFVLPSLRIAVGRRKERPRRMHASLRGLRRLLPAVRDVLRTSKHNVCSCSGVLREVL